jgi:hypothetical protein
VKSSQTSIFAVHCHEAANTITEAALFGITPALESVGRAFIGLDPSYTVHHVPGLLDSSVSGTANPFDLTLARKLNTYFGPARIWWNISR